MSENPGPATHDRHGDEQRTAPVDTGPGPAAADVDPGAKAAEERDDAPDEG